MFANIEKKMFSPVICGLILEKRYNHHFIVQFRLKQVMLPEIFLMNVNGICPTNYSFNIFYRKLIENNFYGCS